MYKRKILFGRAFTVFMVVAILVTLLTSFCFLHNTNPVIAEGYQNRGGAPKGTASVLNLNRDGYHEVGGKAVDNFSSTLIGGQSEYIYFGINPETYTPMLWRVLDANDTRYSQNGGILLWADNIINSTLYNLDRTDVQQAFWNNSKIHAELNGGSYIGNNSIPVGESLYEQMFVGQKARDSVVPVDYETMCYAYKSSGNVTANYYRYCTTQITSTSSNGYYTDEMINNAVNARKDGTSVIETSIGDYLFLLDYHDINNPLYGFVDGDGDTYADKVLSYGGTKVKWEDTGDKRGYPAYYDYNNRGSVTGPESMQLLNHYWLRPSGRDGNNSQALIVSKDGYYVHYGHAGERAGVRPGFVFNPQFVIYATASTGGKGNTFSSVTERNNSAGVFVKKPSFKTFMQTESFTNYNIDGGAPMVIIENGKVKVQKSGQTGAAVILLSDKNGNGKVSYQATAMFNGSGIAEATIPSDMKNISDYNMNILFCKNYSGDNYSVEKVDGVYTNNGLAKPEDTSIVYQGRDITLADFAKAEKADWFNASIYSDPSKMEVEFIGPRKNVGDTCTVNFTLKAGNNLLWWDETTGTKSIKLTISPVLLKVNITPNEGAPPVFELVKDGILGGESPPELIVYYKGRDGTEYEESAIPPRKKGKYTARVELSADCKNYKLDKEYNQDFELFAEIVYVPTINGDTAQVYNGSAIEFVVDGFDESTTNFELKEDGTEFKKVDGVWKFFATNAKKYTIKFTLKDNVETIWSDKTNGAQALDVEITKKELGVAFFSDSGKWNWAYDQDMEVYVAPNGICAGDNLEFVFGYKGAEYDPSKVQDGKYYLTISQGLTKGDYTLTLSLKGSSDNNKNANYYLSYNTITFTITGLTGDFDPNLHLKWMYTNGGGEPRPVPTDKSFAFNGKEFVLSIDESELASHGVRVVGYSGQNNVKEFGRYTTTVKIGKLNENYEIEDQMFSITWQIQKIAVDMPKTTIEDFEFDNIEHEIVDLFGLTGDWNQYFGYTIKKGGKPFDKTSIIDAATYNITFAFHESVLHNVQWKGTDGDNDDIRVTIKISVKEIRLTGWSNGTLPVPKFGDAFVNSEYYEVVYFDSKGNEFARKDVSDHFGENCKAIVREPENMKGNVRIIPNEGISKERPFIPFDGPAEVLDHPFLTETVFVYNGAPQNILKYLERFDGEKMAISGDKNPIDAGDNYKITITILPGVHAVWADDVESIVLEFVVNKCSIDEEWDDYKYPPELQNNGSIVDYFFYDMFNDPVDRDSLVVGTQYKVEAVIKEQYFINYGFGNTLSQNSQKYVFRMSAPVEVDAPAFEIDKITFDGVEHTFKLKGDTSYFEFDASELKKTNAGKFSITITLKNGAVWADGYSERTRTLNFEIEKLVLKIPSGLDGDLVYNGNVQTFIPDGLDGSWVIFTGNTGTNAGKYTANAKLKDTENTCWDDQSTGEITFDWNIAKAVIEVSWNTEGKFPVLDIVGRLKNAVEYVFYDQNDKPIAKDKLSPNVEYSVKAKLKAEYAKNYMFDETDSDVTSAMYFTLNKNAGGADGDGSGNGGSWIGTDGNLTLFAWLIVGALIFVAIAVIILALVILLRKNKEKVSFVGYQPTESVQSSEGTAITSGGNSAYRFASQMGIEDEIDAKPANRVGYVNERLMTPKDWTFIVREKDVLNIKALENQTGRVLMYACKENDVKKLKRFENELAEVNPDLEDGSQEQQLDSKNNKKKKKKR